jgi:acyl-CoA reductase-like NAD-dependent aldehyde dehydrogenase
MGLDGSFPMTRDANTSCIVMNEPYGVVLSIAPW